MKVRAAPPGWYYEAVVINPERDVFSPPTGPYFLYGTLQDPRMLVEILDLPNEPALRPAKVVGYEKKLWGQYPALVPKQDGVVHGMVFDVSTVEQGAKLAAYETHNYNAVPCWIRYQDVEGETDNKISGYTFLYAGNSRDLSEGEFDLNTWLKRMRRKPL